MAEKIRGKVAFYARFGSLEQLENSETTTAWIYCRSAAGGNNALQVQRQAALRYARTHNLKVVGESSDIGSGLRYDHPGLAEMLSAVRNGKVTAVIVRDVSRIGRNTIETIGIINNSLATHGVKLLCYS